MATEGGEGRAVRQAQAWDQRLLLACGRLGKTRDVACASAGEGSSRKYATGLAKTCQSARRQARGGEAEHAPGGHQDDPLGNLTQVARSGGETIEYIIDSQGRRVGKQVDGVLAQQFVWSGPLVSPPSSTVLARSRRGFIYGHGVNVPALIVKLDAVYGDRVFRVITDQLALHLRRHSHSRQRQGIPS